MSQGSGWTSCVRMAIPRTSVGGEGVVGSVWVRPGLQLALLGEASLCRGHWSMHCFLWWLRYFLFSPQSLPFLSPTTFSIVSSNSPHSPPWPLFEALSRWFCYVRHRREASLTTTMGHRHLLCGEIALQVCCPV